MSKKLIALTLLAGLMFSTNYAFAQDACSDAAKAECKENKRALSSDCFCCCTKVSETATDEVFECKPTTPAAAGDSGQKVCPKDTVKIGTLKNDTCICKFTKKKRPPA